MRRFMVHLVTEIDFKDGDEASDAAARTTRRISRKLFGMRPRGYRSTQSRMSTSRVSRSQKSRPSFKQSARTGGTIAARP